MRQLHRTAFPQDSIYTMRIRFRKIPFSLDRVKNELNVDKYKLRNVENMTMTVKWEGDMLLIFKLLGYLFTN